MKVVEEFKNTYPNYEIVNFTKPYNKFYFNDENGFLHKKINIYRALGFKIGIESVVNKVLYIQHKLDRLEKNYILICYSEI